MCEKTTETVLLIEKPLITFALFAYNQEKYIREAVEGAFSQTYEPLEIILSDDCSSDRTYQIMQEMTAEYQGPHLVRTNRNLQNIGIIDHVITVAKISNGELMIVAAGDDISYPSRSAKVSELWEKSDAMAIYSNCDKISEHGKITITNFRPTPVKVIQDLFNGFATARRYDGLVRNIPGYSAAYHTNLFSNLPLNNCKSNNEDALSTYLINIKGGAIEYIDEALLSYRQSNSSISVRANAKNISEIIENEYILKRFSISTLAFLPYFYNIARSTQSPDVDLLIRRLKKSEDLAKIVSQFWDCNFLRRINMLRKVQSFDEIKFILTRIFGIHFYAVVKYAYATIRR